MSDYDKAWCRENAASWEDAAAQFDQQEREADAKKARANATMWREREASAPEPVYWSRA